MPAARLAWVWIWIAVTTLPAVAASLTVVVRERAAGPIVDQEVNLVIDSGYGLIRIKTRSTDRAGTVVFPDLRPGTYTLDLGPILDSRLVRPQDNPWAAPPRRVITAADERASVLIEVWRGEPIVARWLAEPDPYPPLAAEIVFTSQSGGSVRFRTSPGEPIHAALVPGRWLASFEAPEGYLLEDLELDGASVPGATATIDLAQGSSAREVAWKLVAPCLIQGRVETVGPPLGPWTVIARLVEPGDWHTAATQQGRPIPARVIARQSDRDRYELRLPSGRWRLEVDTSGRGTSDPPFVDVSLVRGETRRVDFQLRFAEEPERTLRVRVVDPEMRTLRDAQVELRSIDDEGKAGPVVATAISDPMAEFRALDPAKYLIVAGHEGFMEATENVSVDPREHPKSSMAVVQLRPGAVIRVHATTRGDEPVAGVRTEVVREGPLDSLLTNTEFLARKTHAAASTDALGLAEITGLYPGRYRIEGFLDAGEEKAGVVTFGTADEAPRTTTVELTEAEHETLEARILPAAGVAGSLRCGEGPAPAPFASLRVISVEAASDVWDDPDLRKGEVQGFDRVPLRGKSLDRFAVGPLEVGAFKVAIRPAGVETWTWVGGRFTARSALTIQLERGTMEDLGSIITECGPIVALQPTLSSKEPPPDLTLSQVGFSAARIRSAGESAEALRARVEVVGSQALALGLPEGDVEVKVRVEHPYLVPSVFEETMTLRGLARGKVVHVPVRFERLGGELDVRTAAPAVRARGAEGFSVAAVVAGGVAVIPGLLPGKYRVDVCADGKCERVTSTWQHVEIEPARTTHLP